MQTNQTTALSSTPRSFQSCNLAMNVILTCFVEAVLYWLQKPLSVLVILRAVPLPIPMVTDCHLGYKREAILEIMAHNLSVMYPFPRAKLHHQFPIRRECHTPHPTRIPFDYSANRPRGGIPKPDCHIIRGGCYRIAIQREHHTPYPTRMTR